VDRSSGRLYVRTYPFIVADDPRIVKEFEVSVVGQFEIFEAMRDRG
jgi:hypothetical protein